MMPRRLKRVLVTYHEDGKLRECWLPAEDQRFIEKVLTSGPGEHFDPAD